MVAYAYKAADPKGNVVQGNLEAVDETAVVAELHAKGFIPIRIKPVDASPPGQAWAFLKQPARWGSTVRGRDVAGFTRDLATLFGAGLPIDRALAILIEATENPRFKPIVTSLLEDVQGGSYLSDAMAKHPRIFSRFYTNMVRAGEVGGVLETVLARLSEFLEENQDLVDYIRSAMIYPVFLVVVGGVSILILLTFVIPKFAVIFADLGQALPLSTRFILGFSTFLRDYAWAILLLAGGFGYAVGRYLRTPVGRYRMDHLKLRLPGVQPVVEAIETARFTRTLGTLIQSGVPILKALMLVRDVIVNRVLADAVETIQDRVKEGESLARPMADSGRFPPLAVQMVTVGEETGQLGGMLLKIADSYDKRVRSLVKRLINLLEPVMILLMGLVVGFVVISMLTAIFSINELPF
jgi:general secretion pathway protein F